jgi:hypothetical protein
MSYKNSNTFTLSSASDFHLYSKKFTMPILVTIKVIILSQWRDHHGEDTEPQPITKEITLKVLN